MRLEAEVREAFTRLRKALEAHLGHGRSPYLEASLARSRAKEALEMALAQGLLSGEIVGKNAEEREAKARSLFGAPTPNEPLPAPLPGPAGGGRGPPPGQGGGGGGPPGAACGP